MKLKDLNINNIGRDKLLHIVVSAFIATCIKGAFAISLIMLDRVDLAIYTFTLAYIGTIAVGVCKEIYDWRKGGLFDKKDILADFLGAYLGAF